MKKNEIVQLVEAAIAGVIGGVLIYVFLLMFFLSLE